MSASQPHAAPDAAFRAGLKAEAACDYAGALLKYGAALQPGINQPVVWRKIGMMHLQLGLYHEAIQNLEFALRLAPDDAETIYGLAIASFYLGQLEASCDYIERAAGARPDNPTYALDRANILSIAQPDPARKLALYRDWGQRFADPLARDLPFNLDRSPDRRLRVGYVSGDLREHAIAFFMEPVLANHDPAAVEVFVFATSPQQDAVTRRLKKLVPHWFDVARLNDGALFNLIRKKRIDILVDLSGHTRGHRLPVFAMRAAPVQATWLGYVGGTLGMRAMDYRLTDSGMDPAGSERFYVEKLFRLNCMASYQPPTDAPLEPQPPMLRGNPPTLVSLNGSRKLTDQALLLWKRILTARPDAQLLLHAQTTSVEEAVSTMEPRLTRLQLPLDRIIVSPMVPMAEFMTRGHVADVALDTFPVSGGTTTLHTLWMGLPIITMDAAEAVSASTAATLKGLQLGHWVARDEDEYIARVLHLLDHPEQLTAHRANARRLLRQSALMDYAGRCRELEAGYRRLWLNHLLGEARLLDLATPCADVLEQLRNAHAGKREATA